MVFHWSLSDSKSQVSRTLLSIMADLNNAVIWIVPTSPVISKSSRPLNILVTVTRAPITGTTSSFMFLSYFESLTKSSYLSFFSLSFNFTQWLAGTGKTKILQVLFLVDYYKVWSSGFDLVIRLYLKISEEFVRLLHQDISWVGHILFVRMVKFKFLAQFLVDHLAYPAVSSLILFQC